MLRFKDLSPGEVFRFESEVSHPEWGLCKGPWRKISARKYMDLKPESQWTTHKVGSISAEVVRAEESA